MRKARGALLAMAMIFAGMTTGVPHATGEGNYVVSINDVSVAEGRPASFTVTVSPRPQEGDEIEALVETSDGTAVGGPACGGADFVHRSDIVVLTRAVPSRSFNVQTCDDTVDEAGEESFFADVVEAAVFCEPDGGGEGGEPDDPCDVTLGDASGRGTIRDNEADASPSPSASPSGSPSASPTGSPGDVVPQGRVLTVVDHVGRAGPGSNCRFHVNRVGNLSALTTVNYASAGKAKLVANVAGTLVFAPGETVKSVDVDVLRRPRRQKFVTLTLSGASNATISDQIGLCELKTRRR